MTRFRALPFAIPVTLAVTLLSSVAAPSAQQATAPFEPRVGQSGKDVVWVPTPQALVDKMLDMAEVTPRDFLMDLGSGDGITVITAAKRGVRAVGIEYNPDMVALSRKNAVAAGVTSLASFENADLFETDLSKATVITMFLLPSINMKLRPTLLDLKPGTRIVANTFTMEDWAPDRTETVEPCDRWCTALMWIVPAKVEGTWRAGRESLTLTQQFQKVSGTLGSAPIVDGKLRGDEISFDVGSAHYTGRVNGNAIRGTSTADGRTTDWSASRQ
jgi:hypothetical protein